MKLLNIILIILVYAMVSSAQDIPRYIEGHKIYTNSKNEDKKWQTPKPVLNHTEYDVLNYEINIQLFPEDQKIEARADILLYPRENIENNLEFDFVGLAVDSVFLNNLQVQTALQGEILQIQIPAQIMVGDTQKVSIYYQGSPQKGIYFRTNIYGDTVIYSHNEPFDAHHWFPCKDDPADKATLDMSITVPTHYAALSNGQLTGQNSDGSGITIYTWEENFPIATYLVSLAVAQYSVVNKLFIWNNIELLLQYYVYPEDVERGENALNLTAEMMGFYSSYIGEYPFLIEKYAMSEVPLQEAAAMENQTATTMGDFVMDNENVIAHELAHQWWGNALTPKSFVDIWLNEGFATYFDALFTEYKYGQEEFLQQMNNYASQMGADGSLNFPVYDPPAEYLFGSAVYMKGAWVLHMLRLKTGDSAFQNICQTYFYQNRYQNVTTEQFIETAEIISQSSLSTFFDQWLHYGDIPRLIGSWKQKNGAVELTIKQDQIEPVYRFDLEVLIEGASIDTLIIIPLDDRTIQYNISFADPVSKIIIDPYNKILNSNNGPLFLIPKQSSLVKLYPNPFNEIVTITYQLKKVQKVEIEIYNILGEKVETLIEEKKRIGLHNTFWYGKEMASGTYYCVMKTSESIDIRKMVLLK